MSRHSGEAVGHETTDAAPRLLIALAAGIAAFLVITPFALGALFPDSLRAGITTGDIASVPSPRLQADPQQDLAALREAEQRRLAGYAWRDREHDGVRIPIERAIELTLARGLPGWRKP